MFSTVLKEVTDTFDRRFLLNAFFPSLVFWGLLLTVFAAGQGNLLRIVTAWNDQPVLMQTLQIIGFVAWVTFFAYTLSSQLTIILRLYEGYWGFPGGRYLHRLGQSWHQSRLRQLDQSPEGYESIYLGYPLPTQIEQVMPTRLGNILKNAELYPLDRYQIDAVLIWPRLYNTFPDKFIQTIADARSAVDFMLTISALSGLFAFLAGAYLVVVGAVWWLFLACFWGSLLIAWLAYEGAVRSAVPYAQQIKAAFDLYRTELLKQYRLTPPATPDAEESCWHELGLFLYRNVREQPGTWTYTGGASPSSKGNDSWLQRILKRLGL
jgi:hypothetical protein